MLLVIVFKCPISYREILFCCCHFDLSHSGSFLLISSDPWMPLLIVRLWRTPGSHSLASGVCWQQSGNFSWKTCVCRGVLLKMVWEKDISCLLFEMGERLRQVKSSCAHSGNGSFGGAWSCWVYNVVLFMYIFASLISMPKPVHVGFSR